MCAMDAMWRTYGYQTYPASIPAVNQIKVVLEDVYNQFMLDGKCLDLAVYFNRPVQLQHLLYTDMYNAYSWSYKLQKTYASKPELLNIDYFVIRIAPLTKNIYVAKKINPKPSITRLNMLCILSGEIYFLRELMLHCIWFVQCQAPTGDLLVLESRTWCSFFPPSQIDTMVFYQLLVCNKLCGICLMEEIEL